MALGNTDSQGPRHFRFGFMASSDNHSARPGTGYKEFDRTEMTDARFLALKDSILGRVPAQKPSARSVAYDPQDYPLKPFGTMESERQASFFTTGGLIAAHSRGRDRDSIWDAWQRREVYGTSGPRILLWFDLLEGTAANAKRHPMGAEVSSSKPPRFEVRALGSYEQKPGCPDYAANAVGPEKLATLCRSECYNPSNLRRPISRIEVVRIKPQADPDEAIDPLIEDAWRVFHCSGSRDGCRVSFTDEEFDEVKRDTLYYVRAIEEASPAVNGANLRCESGDDGRCEAVTQCNTMDPAEDCLSASEQRAWSSPIFVNYQG
jgi:hypothetical protein